MRRCAALQPVPVALVAAREYTPGPVHIWPKDAERRLTYQVYRYWDALRQQRPFPSHTTIDGSAPPDFWPSCFILDTLHDYPTPYFQYLGKSLAAYSGIYLSGKDDWDITLLDKSAAQLDRVLASREPVVVEDTFVRYDGRQIAFRGIMLPLSENGEKISHVLGAANYKRIRNA